MYLIWARSMRVDNNLIEWYKTSVRNWLVYMHNAHCRRLFTVHPFLAILFGFIVISIQCLTFVSPFFYILFQCFLELFYVFYVFCFRSIAAVYTISMWFYNNYELKSRGVTGHTVHNHIKNCALCMSPTLFWCHFCCCSDSSFTCAHKSPWQKNVTNLRRCAASAGNNWCQHSTYSYLCANSNRLQPISASLINICVNCTILFCFI